MTLAFRHLALLAQTSRCTCGGEKSSAIAHSTPRRNELRIYTHKLDATRDCKGHLSVAPVTGVR